MHLHDPGWTGDGATTQSGGQMYRIIATAICLSAAASAGGLNGALADSAGPSSARKVAWSSVTGGYQHTCSIHLNRSLWCWGNNGVGQLGIGNHHSPEL